MATSTLAIKDEFTALQEERRILAEQQKALNAKLAEIKKKLEEAKSPEQKVLDNLRKSYTALYAKAKNSEYADALKLLKHMQSELQEAIKLESAH